MKESVTVRYCDILSEHHLQKVAGAKHYTDVSVLVRKPGEPSFIKEVDIDMCDACKAKYAPNLIARYSLSSPVVCYFNDNFAFTGTTWVFNETFTLPNYQLFMFNSSGPLFTVKYKDADKATEYVSIRVLRMTLESTNPDIMYYTDSGYITAYNGTWSSTEARTITFVSEPNCEDEDKAKFVEWFTANATMQ